MNIEEAFFVTHLYYVGSVISMCNPTCPYDLAKSPCYLFGNSVNTWLPISLLLSVFVLANVLHGRPAQLKKCATWPADPAKKNVLHGFP